MYSAIVEGIIHPVSWNPGAVLPGVVGGLSLLLASFALSVLPINHTGLLLVFFGLALFALEIKVVSDGVLTVGGLVSLVFGSMMLVDSSLPELQVNLWAVLPVVLAVAGIAMLLARLALVAQQQPTVTGLAAMIGRVGRTLSAIAPEQTGTVDTHGEIWRASAAEQIPEGARVRVIAVDGLTLIVRRD